MAKADSSSTYGLVNRFTQAWCPNGNKETGDEKPIAGMHGLITRQSIYPIWQLPSPCPQRLPLRQAKGMY